MAQFRQHLRVQAFGAALEEDGDDHRVWVAGLVVARERADVREDAMLGFVDVAQAPEIASLAILIAVGIARGDRQGMTEGRDTRIWPSRDKLL